MTGGQCQCVSYVTLECYEGDILLLDLTLQEIVAFFETIESHTMLFFVIIYTKILLLQELQ